MVVVAKLDIGGITNGYNMYKDDPSLTGAAATVYYIIGRSATSIHGVSSAASAVYRRQYMHRTRPDMHRARGDMDRARPAMHVSLIHITEPTRPERISYAAFCLKKKNTI